MKNPATPSTVESGEQGNRNGHRITRWHRPGVNITSAERVGRVAMGLAAIVAGTVLLASAGSALAVILEVLLIAAGADLVVTGALGHCPLYAKLDHLPKSLRKTS